MENSVKYAIRVTCTKPKQIEREGRIMFLGNCHEDNNILGCYFYFDGKEGYNDAREFFLEDPNRCYYKFTTKEKKIKMYLQPYNAKHEAEAITRYIAIIKRKYNLNIDYRVEVVEVKLSFKKYEPTE